MLAEDVPAPMAALLALGPAHVFHLTAMACLYSFPELGEAGWGGPANIYSAPVFPRFCRD